jgi:magnesium transporter
MQVRAVVLDFAAKTELVVSLTEAVEQTRLGRATWIDIELSNAGEAEPVLNALGLISPEILEDALYNEPLTRLARFEECVHFVVSGCRPDGHAFELERADVIIGETYVITLHRGPVVFLDQVMRQYRADFERFAQSLSFLVYEVWDHLIDNYLSVQKLMEERVEELQSQLRSEQIDDAVFAQMSELGADLLHFRKVLLPARSVLTDLSARKSLFISSATQPFLANMVGAVEHVLQDLLVDRDILSESLNLYMSMVSHRTNEVMKRLTVVSVIFLPLTFLVGVYGMNFEVLPELRWRFGYAAFWLAVIVIAGGLLWLLKRHRLL